MSDSEVDLLSDPSQKFVPQEDDEETLWEVTEILDEKRTQYKVRWKGNDPKTMKPWKPSWVAKHDCTDDLVREWKRKKQEKQQRKSAKRGRTSTASKRASTASTVKHPLSKATILSTSTRTTVDEATNRRRRSNPANSRSTETATPKKFTRDAIREDEEENEVDQPQKPTKAQKGTKRKRVEADSANSSANQASGRGGTVDIEVSDDETTTKKRKTPVPASRPSKKRKVEVSGSSLPPTQLSTASIPAIRQEEGSGDEEEERMVEDALSEGLPSPTRNLEHDTIIEEDFVYPDEQDVVKPEEPLPTKDKGKGKARAVFDDDDDDDDDDDESPKATKSRPSSSKRKSPLFFPSSPPSPPPERRIGPPKGKRPSQPNGTSKFKSRSKSTSREAAAPPSKKPAQTVKKPRLGIARPYNLGSETEHDAPALEWFTLQEDGPLAVHSASKLAPANGGFWEAPVSSPQRQPVLSPAAWQRLEQFDVDVGLKKAKRTAAAESDDDDDDEVEIVQEKEKADEEDRRSHSTSSKRPSLPIPSRYYDKPTSSTSKNPPSNTQRRPTNAHTNSYITDVVPETDQEQSQSQSQEKEQPPAGPPSTPQGKPTLKSRMKPRTPLSRNSSSAQIEDNANGKALRPIPMLSPSTFHPLMHLDSSLPDSIIESAGSHEDNRHDGEEEDAPMSSIEQFDSPEKDNRTQGRKKVLLRKERVGDRKGKGKERQRDEDTDIWHSEQVARRGQELAEAAKRKQRAKAHSEGGSSAEADSDEPGKQKKKSVDEIIARSRSRSESVASSKHPAAGDEDEADEEGVADASTTVVPSGSGPQVDDAGAEAVPRPSAPAMPHPEHDLTTLQQMEDAYVDLSGGVDETIDDDHDTNQAHIDPKDLRREEEESTQDLMEEVRAAQMQQRSMQDVDMDAGWLAGSSKAAGPPEAAPQEGDEGDEHRDDVSMVPEIHIENPSREPSTRSLSPEDDISQPVQRMTRSRSRSKTPTVVSSKASSKPKSTLRVPAVKGPSRRSAQPTTTRSRSKSPSFKQPVEEIIHENPLEEERSRNETLEQELASIREQLQRLKESTKSRDAEAIERLSEIQVLLKNKQAEWASERAQLIAHAESANRDKDIETTKLVTELQALWASEKAGWETERSQLIARLESATKSKESAEKDRDFFREQYGQASGFVNAVRDENKDLEKRVKIAEDQAQSGVNLVKSTFELRIKTLEDDAKVWRKMAEFAIEKDRRTNDDIRRRAAEEPGLRARCEEQEKDIDELHHHLEVIEIELQEKEQDVSRVNAELVQWKKETTRLTGELNEALIKLDRIGRAGDEDSQGNGHEFVYRCQWRLDGNNEACPETFLTLTELEDHLFTGAHLRST